MAPIDFKKIFANKEKYPDTFKMMMGDAEVTLGDLREYDASVGGDLHKELERQRQELEVDRTKVNDASNRVAQMYVELETQRKALPTNQPTTTNDPLSKYEEDEVFRPVVQHMRTIESSNKKAVDDMTAKLDQVVRSIAQMGSTYMGDKAKADFSAIPADDPVRPTNLSLDNLYKFAVEQRVYDRNNLPDMQEAYKRLTADARYKHDVAAAEQRGRELAQRDLAESAMLPRPTSGMPALPEGVKPPLNLADAFGKAGQDRDLWKNINNANGVQ